MLFNIPEIEVIEAISMQHDPDSLRHFF